MVKNPGRSAPSTPMVTLKHLTLVPGALTSSSGLTHTWYPDIHACKCSCTHTYRHTQNRNQNTHLPNNLSAFPSPSSLTGFKMNANCRSFLTFSLAPGDLGLEDHGGLPGGSVVLECSDGSRGERKLPWELGSSFGERKDQAKFPEGCTPWWPATPDKEMTPERSLCASEAHRAKASGGRQAPEMLPAPHAQNFLLGWPCSLSVLRTETAGHEIGSVIRLRFPLFRVCSVCRCKCAHTCMWKPRTTSGGVPHTPLHCFLRQHLSLAWGDLARLTVPFSPALGLHLCTATFMFMGLRDRMQDSCFQDKHFLQVYFNLLS